MTYSLPSLPYKDGEFKQKRWNSAKLRELDKHECFLALANCWIKSSRTYGLPQRHGLNGGIG